jgi:glycosyltransferase 2 family protein
VKLDWRVALGFVLSGVLLWLALRNVELGDVMRALRNANGPLFVLSAVVSTCIFPLRAIRWRSILAPVAGAVPFGPLWRSTAIGMMVNNVVPARAGEVARAFALTREVPRVPFTTSLASLAVDRIFDAIVLLALMFGAMLSPRFPAGAELLGLTVPQFAAIGMTGVLGLLGVCWLAVLMPTRVIAIVRAIAGRLVPRFEGRLVAIAEQGLGGLAVLRDGTRFLVVLWWALVHWLVHALALWIGFAAVGIDLPISSALFLQGVLGFAVALPSSPGFVGFFELGAQVGLGVYGVSESQALTWALGYHALSFIPITLFGLFYLLRLGITLGDIRGAADRSSGVRDAREAFVTPTPKDPAA